VPTLLEIAIAGLRRNRLRTGLTVLSLVVGVSAVIATVALGAGARAALERQVRAAGTNLIIVSAGNWTSCWSRSPSGGAKSGFVLPSARGRGTFVSSS
jgi:putative ABC transport system permease protein